MEFDSASKELEDFLIKQLGMTLSASESSSEESLINNPITINSALIPFDESIEISFIKPITKSEWEDLILQYN